MAFKGKLQPKQEFQKADCINPRCKSKQESTLEVVYGRAHVRCCTNEDCIAYASRRAVDCDELFSLPSQTLADIAQHNFV